MAHTRTQDAMMSLFRCAKLDPSLSAFVRSVHFSDHLVSDEYKLFEVEPELADELSNPGSPRTIELKDEPGKSGFGRVYACATDQTYSVVETETSNTLLLIPDGSVLLEKPRELEEPKPAVVHAMKTSYLELQPCIAPSLRLLKQKLLLSEYHGPFEDECDDCYENSAIHSRPLKFTRSELGVELPCSKNELCYAFARLRVFEIEGFMRLVDPDYLVEVIRNIFSCADEHAWDWRQQGFSVRSLVENLEKQYSTTILNQVIGLYFYPRNSTPSCSGLTDLIVFPINSRICQLIGEQLLSVTNSFDLNDFKAVWKATVPSGLRPKLRKHLTCAGRAYCGTPGSSNTNRTDHRHPLFRTISLLRSEDLPDDTIELRLQALFERCSAWPELELASFLTDLVIPPDTTCKHYLDPVMGPLMFPCSISDSDFEYSDEIESEFPESTASDGDSPKQASAAVVTILNRLCRATTTTDQGRIYTQKYGNT
ncbi:Sister chromatid cohesion protein DCC1 [Fasciola gigantica]|uniref:Sister chromatid cohesion protein DCC1 n=1 Tax=Fasciola gigantica TaxID=46835 RepID=A0A504Z151_FASGI|nr:Sister chromatid cohesion protein DCC1 [Fasciola gigantica]